MDLLDSMLPEHLKGEITLQEYLHLSDAQWEVMINASPEEQLVYRAKARPQTDDELFEYIRFVWGVTFPRTCHPDCAKKEVPCTPPFKVLADGFFGRYPLIILKASRGSGKAQTLTSKILTPTGWTTMGEIKVGDQVIDEEGNPVNVTHLHPQGLKEVYRITFNDGSFTECCDDHLWKIRREWKNAKWQTLPLKEFKDFLLKRRTNDKRWRIPMTSPVKFYNKNLNIDPYLMGLMLGDGCLMTNNVVFTTKDTELIDRIKDLLPEGICVSFNAPYQYRLNRGKTRPGVPNRNVLRTMFRELGLVGKNSKTKFIPKDYLYSSPEQRLALLQGLLDTDGSYKSSDKSVTYFTVSKDLMEGVKFIVQSLGGTVTARLDSNRGEGNSPLWRLRLKLDINPFRLRRKADIWRPAEKYKINRYVSSVEYVGRNFCQCITVDSPTSTYLTNDCIVTHNSVLLGLLSLTEQVSMDAQVLMLGGSETQARVIFDYISQRTSRFPNMFWANENAPKALQNQAAELQTSSKIVTGGEIKANPASETSILGQRPSRLRMDEVDKVRPELIESALPCCHPDRYKGIRNQTILSSTHYDAKGTLTKYIDRANQANAEAGEIVMPVYQFCYKDVLEENGGYLTKDLLRDMKLSVDKHTWLRQFENGEPAIEGTLFSEEDLDFLFDDGLGTFESPPKPDCEEHIVNPDFYSDEIYTACYAGCDFGDKRDWTIVSKFRCDENDEYADICTHWLKSGRCGLGKSAKKYNNLLSIEETSAAHDATGCSQFVTEELTEGSEGVVFNKKWKHEALTQFITAVEAHKLKLPRIPSLEKAIRYVTYEECFGTDHLPDEMASLILAWWARRRVMRSFNIGSIRL